ncbi:hypothetical protein [Listeria seeligeri]|uniref:hypothetical protein n=1 Tax=Listeria seeligeri TaxID=1640 RepID=UPI001886CCCC|nr:hypothetical protein [Listeria seeligeri]MBF2346288.1 hypothetical protein [Listeria seeligeri]
MDLSISVLNIIGISLEIIVSIVILISEKNKSKNLRAEAENEYKQQMNNIINNTQGNNASFNLTQVQMMQSNYQDRTYKEILSNLKEKRANKEEIKFNKKCTSLKKRINIICLIVAVFWMYYFFDLVQSFSFSIYLLNVLFQTVFMLSTIILFFSVSNFIKLFFIVFREYNYKMVRRIQLFVITLFTTIGSSAWIYYDWKSNFKPLFNSYTEGSYFTLGLIMLWFVIYLVHQISQNFLLNNYWIPKKAIKVLSVALIYNAVTVTCVLLEL